MKQQDKQFDIELEHDLEASQIQLSTRSTHYCITASLCFPQLHILIYFTMGNSAFSRPRAPRDLPPEPGEPGFIGPLLPENPQPGQPGFIGPLPNPSPT
jgi:hypothetical protein